MKRINKIIIIIELLLIVFLLISNNSINAENTKDIMIEFNFKIHNKEIQENGDILFHFNDGIVISFNHISNKYNFYQSSTNLNISLNTYDDLVNILKIHMYNKYNMSNDEIAKSNIFNDLNKIEYNK